MSSNEKRITDLDKALQDIRTNNDNHKESVDKFITDFQDLPSIIAKSTDFTSSQKTWLLDMVQNKIMDIANTMYEEIKNGS